MKIFATGLIISLALGASARAISISIDFMDLDDPFFTTDAKATLNKAAADVSFAITTSLTALSQDIYTGTNGGSNVNVDWDLEYRDPGDGATVLNVPTFSFAADEFVIRVGSRPLGGGALGVGAPAGAFIGFSGDDAGDGTFASAVDALEASSNTGMSRGGPILSTLSGVVNGENYDLSYGYALGVLAFDNASTSWNFSYSSLPNSEQSDFYSVAIHEILHGLGIGAGATWVSNVSGTDWTGPTVINLLGDGVDVIDLDGDHVRSNLVGNAIIDGVQTTILQEVAMGPSLTQGTRKYLTDLDLAFLNDMGWSVIPEPSHATLTALSLLVLAFRRKR